MDQNNLMGLMALRDAFGGLSSAGGGNPGPQNALPQIMRMKQEEAEMQKAREAFQQAQQGGGLPMGFNSPAMQAFASQNPKQALALAAQRSVEGPGKRNMVKGADGYQYYPDTGERVLPGVVKPRRTPEARSALAKLRQDLSEGLITPEDFQAGRDKILSNPDAGPSGPDFDSESKLRKEFNSVSADFRTVRDAYSRIESSAKDPSAAGDLAMIFNYMKVLDPGSVVRESEFATAANSAGVPDRIRATYNKVLSGERLADAQRADFLNRGQKLYQGRLDQYAKTEGEYRKLAKSYSFDPARIVPDFNLPNPSEPSPQIGAPGAGPRRTIGGITYEQRNGKWGVVQ